MAQTLEEKRMSRKRVTGGVFVALAVALTVGSLVASNMGFKLNYGLDNTTVGVAKTGQNTLALPDNRQSGMGTAKNLMDDIGLASVDNVRRFVKSSDTYTSYTGRVPQTAANNFNLTSGEAIFVRMRTTTAYIVVGSDDPALTYTLNNTTVGVAKTGQNFYAYNYHQTAATAKALMDDIGLASVDNIRRFVKSSDTYTSYTGRVPQTAANNFNLTPGEGYFIRMRTTTVYTPSHY
jgi:deoxyinosine 3'endonuclease (endonuclease V)